MSAIGNFQRYIANRMENELNTCPHCGGTPVRIVMSPGLGRERYECTTELCPNYSRQLSLSFEDPEPQVQAVQEEPERPRPVYLWCTHHYDFG